MQFQKNSKENWNSKEIIIIIKIKSALQCTEDAIKIDPTNESKKKKRYFKKQVYKIDLFIFPNKIIIIKSCLVTFNSIVNFNG